jgi:hypothetical protein
MAANIPMEKIRNCKSSRIVDLRKQEENTNK